jgi:hypothetical protein
MNFSRTLVSLCLLAGLAAPAAHAETCLNPDKGRNGDNSDYVKCKRDAPAGSTGAAGAVGAVGKQLGGILGRQAEEESDEDRAYQAERDARRGDVAAWNRGRYKNLKLVTALESNAVSLSLRDRYGYHANARVTVDEAKAVRAAIDVAAKQDKLIATFDDGSFDKPWVSSKVALDNFKRCEVGAALARAHVYGELSKAEKKDAGRGFAIAQAGCDVHCGGTCFVLGRIFEDGDKVAPGVDDVLGKEPQDLMLMAYDKAIMNGVPAAYEREAHINWQAPERYVDKTYFDWSELESRHYWFDIPDYVRLAYAQYKRCLELDASNLNCVRGINGVIELAKSNRLSYGDLQRDIDDDGKAKWFAEQQARLEAQAKAGGTTARP